MKAVLAIVLLAAASAAQAQDSNAGRQPAAPKNLDAGSPWSIDSVTRSDGYFGSSSTTIKRDMGEGWSLGGQMTTPYEDQKIGGGGAPGLKQYKSPGSNTMFGPVLEKKF